MSDITAVFNEFDEDWTAFYTSDSFTVSHDEPLEDEGKKIAIVIRVEDVSDYQDIDRNTLVMVQVVPCEVIDSTWEKISYGEQAESMRHNSQAIMEMCLSYGASAHITPFATGVTFDGPDQTFAEVIESDDWDTITEWIKQHGDKIALFCGRMIGFGLDRPQNRIGETGWDWIMPHMYEDYTSSTLWASRG